MYQLKLDVVQEKKLLGAVCEKCLSAEAASLRALLLLLAHGELSEEEFCSRLGMTQKEVTAALDCFVDAEILARRGKTYTFSPHGDADGASPQKQKTARGASGNEQIPVMAASEAAVRIAQAPELKFLAESLQESFGRLLTQNEISHLISICDYTGLPADVMLMLIEYAAISGKNTLSYIKKVALDWSAREITTHAAADEQIKILLAKNEAASIVRRAFGIGDRELVPKEKDFSAKWVGEYGYKEEMLSAAYQICVMNTGKLNFSYIDKVLTNWHNEKITAPEEIQRSGKKSPASKQTAAAAPSEEFMALAARKRRL